MRSSDDYVIDGLLVAVGQRVLPSSHRTTLLHYGLYSASPAGIILESSLTSARISVGHSLLRLDAGRLVHCHRRGRMLVSRRLSLWLLTLIGQLAYRTALRTASCLHLSKKPSLLRIRDTSRIINIQDAAGDDYSMRFSNVARLYGADMELTLTRLRSARVLVIGLGGVGSWAVEALTRSGIGHLVLLDLDDVCVSNVNRQLPALTSTVGKLKGSVLKQRILDINPTANVTFIADFLRPDNIEQLFRVMGGLDYVVDCADGVTDKAAIVDYCVRIGIPIAVSGGAGGITDPSLIRVSDMARAVGDTLIMRVRKKLRQDYGYPEGRNTNAQGLKVDKKWRVMVAHSLPTGSVRQAQSRGEGSRKCDAVYGNSCFGTGTLGFALSSIVVNAIATDSVTIPRRLGWNATSPVVSQLMDSDHNAGSSKGCDLGSNSEEASKAKPRSKSTSKATACAPSSSSKPSAMDVDVDEIARSLAGQSCDYFDAHCHLQLHPSFDIDRCDALIQSALSSRVNTISVCGVCPGEDWSRVETLMNAHPEHIVPHFGVHPWWIARLSEADERCWEDMLRELLLRYPRAGVGECGLDSNVRRDVDADRQVALLRRHIAIASELRRSVTIHCVGMWGKLLEVLTSSSQDGLRPMSYVLHSCNSLPADMVQSFSHIDSLYFSLSAGRFENPKFRRLVNAIPVNKLLLETDSPDQLALPLRGRFGSNEPSLLPYECFRLAKFLGIEHDVLAGTTNENAVKAFGLQI